ncbi:DUF2147 domain-containing protein [Parasphingopyxis lamellibrachiae]|uniref:Uncharacterized protein DUF2147 n=1 Tax=Parasphingopyxis lamellibrachiae TaxID=680125 RepID=A0A3D9FFC9_9SPHN|nr:DUF2147 domain-containing protein [Parasphingopyxis lamellibrachiae]RED16524.1 uncharacterized protein DUF2147 [Parasphingopyxis lamellibrachiae]
MKFFSFAAMLGLLALSAPAAAQSGITGNWLTEDNRAVIAIGRCGETLCGRITRILVPTEAGQRDVNNPDPNLRNRRIEGSRVLTGFRFDRGQYRHGQVYDPENGRSYNARLRLNRDGTLRVTGCVLGGIICQSQNWTRR